MTVDPAQRDSIFSRLPPRGGSRLWSMAYCSRMASPLSDDALAGLAIHADARNQTLDVVGVLFVAGGRFLQVLEGERAAVRWLYDVIAQDPRHRRVTKLMDMPIERRAFDGWSMRLICDADLADRSWMTVLKSLETARLLDAGERARISAPQDLRSVPPALVRSVLGRVGRPDGPAPAVDRLAG